MEKQKPQTEAASYTGRFGDQTAGRSRSNENRRTAPSSSGPQRPSGFGTAGQPSKPRPTVQPEKSEPDKQKAKKTKKKNAVQDENKRGDRKKHPVLKALAIIAAVALIATIVLVILYGGEDQSYHQMPKIERESVASFDPEETPMPGTEAQ